MAAGPIVHAYLTQRFFEHHPKYTKQEQQSFMLGTLFPDIQYLGGASRHETHCEHHVTLQEVLDEEAPFMAGMKFHSYVDWVREDFVREQKMYEQLGDICPEQQQIIFLKLKLMEDEVVFAAQDWREWCEVLQEIHSEELNWGVSLQTVRTWHNLLNVCFTNPPSTIIFLLSVTNISFLNIPSEAITQWSKVLKPTAQSSTIQRFVKAMLWHFEEKIAASSSSSLSSS